MFNQVCLSFALSKAFIKHTAGTQGPPVRDLLALLSYSQGLTGVGWRLNLRGPVLHRVLVDIKHVFSAQLAVSELWS